MDIFEGFFKYWAIEIEMHKLEEILHYIEIQFSQLGRMLEKIT